jgi:hypothetical protein
VTRHAGYSRVSRLPLVVTGRVVLAHTSPLPDPPFNPCVRSSGTRLADDLRGMATRPPDSELCHAGDAARAWLDAEADAVAVAKLPLPGAWLPGEKDQLSQLNETGRRIIVGERVQVAREAPEVASATSVPDA